MPISRREFLGRAAGASAAGFCAASGLGTLLSQHTHVRSTCALVDPGASSPLRESLAGYEAALSSLNVAFERTSLEGLFAARFIILPAAVPTSPSGLRRVRRFLQDGSVVLYESGAAFLGPEEFSFHKSVIRSVFDLSLHGPVGLWDSADSFKQSPYVDYHWPLVTKVRDFSRAVPVGSENGETTAWFNDLPVAVRRRVGKGTLVFLGSPLGPHLLAEDPQAGRLLEAFSARS